MTKILPESSKRDLAPPSQSPSLSFGQISSSTYPSPLLLMVAVSGLYRPLIENILSSLSEVEQREGEERRVRDRAEQTIYISIMIIHDMIYKNMWTKVFISSHI